MEFPLSVQEPLLTTTQQVESKQWGSFSALGLAYGLQISPAVSAGLTLNLWDDWLGSGEWQHNFSMSGAGTHGIIPEEFEHAIVIRRGSGLDSVELPLAAHSALQENTFCSART